MTIQESLRGIGDRPRKKPGLYFGRQGAAAIVEMISLVNRWLVTICPRGGARTIVAELGHVGSGDQVSILLETSYPASVDPGAPEEWFSEKLRESAVLLVAAASHEMSVDVSQGDHRMVVVVSEGAKVEIGTPPPLPLHRVLVTFRPDGSTFGSLTETEVYQLSGLLEDAAILNPGLHVRFAAIERGIQFSWTYVNGLASWLLKRDHSRWPLHSGTLSFAGSAEEIEVEGHLRFLHAGASELRSWVNLHPCHGGAHFEGLGDALLSMFPDPDAGCRRVAFVTNPDKESIVWLPHCFVGAIKVTLPDPKYAGPTRDILLGAEVRECVRSMASRTLPKLWEESRSRRP